MINRRISRHFLKTCGFKLLSVDETAVEALVRHPGPSIADYDVHGMILNTFSCLEKNCCFCHISFFILGFNSKEKTKSFILYEHIIHCQFWK